METKPRSPISRLLRVTSPRELPKPLSPEISPSNGMSSSKKQPRSLTAAAKRITSTSIGKSGNVDGVAARPWQSEAWEMYDQVGEQHFLTNVLAGQISKARLYVGKSPEGDLAGSSPTPVEDNDIQELLDPLGAGPASSSQFKRRAALNLLVVGEVWLVGIPPRLYPETEEYRLAKTLEDSAFGNLGTIEPIEDDVTKFVWRVISVDEITFDKENVSFRIPEDSSQKVTGNLDEFYTIRVWQQHPRRSWEPDTATKAVLPVLRELVGLTMHVSAQIDSRLAGAGLLIVPQSVQDSIKERQSAYLDNTGADGSDQVDGEETDPFMEDLIEAMTTPIKNRDSASAIVPLTVTVPDEATGKFQYITFTAPLDEEAKELRDEAIRRLALGQDAPPELLLGTGSMNHWGSWLVQEETVNTHITPHLAVLCEALTEQYLRPMLEALGYSKEEVEEYSVWYDVAHLISRPNRGRDALSLYQSGELSGKALRDATGFDETDAPNYDPDAEEQTENTRTKALDLALGLISKAPSILKDVAIEELVDQIEAELLRGDGETPPGGESSPTPTRDSGAGEMPETDQDDAAIDEEPV